MGWTLGNQNRNAALPQDTAYQVLVLEEHALQVVNILMLANSPAIELSEFKCSLKACVFVLMQTVLPIEEEEHGLPRKGKADI